ncbi:hypothetical protein HK104_002293 [Borealophlyctis nickersoniae]|nr:hypothetical protein HK104_002293 [Borealophlyctis nickersoniae]
MGLRSALGRVWLILINLLIVLAGALTIIVGVLYYKNYKDGDDQITVINLELKIVAYGGCSRSKGFLSFYIVALIIGFLLVCAGGAYAIVKVNKAGNSWNDVNSNDWARATNQEKDVIQVLFSCCGFSSTADAYTGPHLYNGTDVNVENVCANTQTAAQQPNCQDAASNFFRNLTKFIGGCMAASGIVILISIVAAVWARRNPKNVGYYPAGPVPAVAVATGQPQYVQQPYAQQPYGKPGHVYA